MLDFNGAATPRLVGRFERDEDGVQELLEDYLAASDKRARVFVEGDLYRPKDDGFELVQPLVVAPSGEVAFLGCVEEGRTHALRWLVVGEDGVPEVRLLRDVVGIFEQYEPFKSTTAWALDTFRGRYPGMITAYLRREYKVICESKIVLNRRLRERLLEALAAQDNLNQITIRCGRTKTQHGYVSGDASWVLKRVGLLKDKDVLNRWCSSEVLGKIALALGLEPRECEVDAVGYVGERTL